MKTVYGKKGGKKKEKIDSVIQEMNNKVLRWPIDLTVIAK